VGLLFLSRVRFFDFGIPDHEIDVIEDFFFFFLREVLNLFHALDPAVPRLFYTTLFHLWNKYRIYKIDGYRQIEV